MIKLKLSKKEYKTLIKSLFLADIVQKGYRPSKVGKSTKAEILLEKLLPYVFEAEVADWVANKGNNKYELSLEKGMEFFEEVEIYDHLSFWSNLATKLAERDVEEVAGDDYMSSVANLERELKAEFDMEDKYLEEFEENGLTNLRLIQPKLN